MESERIVVGWRRYFLVEPPLMMYLFAQALTGTVLTDLIVYRTCQFTLQLNDSECLLLRQNSTSDEGKRLETIVEPYAGIILMAKSLIESLMPAILSLFLGPWSDRYGRKPLLLAGFTGYTVLYFILSLMSTWNIDPWLLLIAFIPPTILGGFCAIILAVLCVISDITEESERGWHLACVQASISVGVMLGVFSGPVIYDQYGYAAVFGVASALCILALLYVLFVIPETVRNPSKITLSSMFEVSLVKELFSSCIQKRQGFNRCVVWCCILILTQYVLVMQGEYSVEFLYTRERLSWDVQQFSYYTATSVMLGVIGTLLVVKVLGGLLKFNEITLAALGCISSLGGSVTKSLVWHPWHMYLSVVISVFGGAIGPMIRTVTSKAAPPQDVGKVFSLTTSMETLSPLGAAPLYTLVYTNYLPPVYPCPVWLVSAGFYLVMILLVICIAVLVRRRTDSPYEPMHQQSE